MVNVDGILDAVKRLSGVSNRTPVLTSRTLNQIVGCSVFVKCENFQRGGAFKFRGAYNAISQLTHQQKEKGITTHSSGNHAQAVALVGQILNIKTTIVMPSNAPKVKQEATKGYGANIILCEPTIEAREEACSSLIKKFGYTLIHPYDNEQIIRGAATAGYELLEEIGNLDSLYVPVGGGGLVSGTSMYAKESGKVRTVIGVEPEGADDAHRSFTTKSLVRSHTPNTIADGLQTVLSPRTFGYITKYVDEIHLVDDRQIIDAMRFLWERMKIVVEPSGAVPLAALMDSFQSKTINPPARIGLIVSGGNVDLSQFFSILES